MKTVMLILLDDRIGGTPNRILKIAKHATSPEIKYVVVIPNTGGNFSSVLEKAGINVVKINVLRLRYSLNPLYLMSWFFNFIPSIYRIMKIIREYRVDVVHAFGLTQINGPIAAKLAGTKLVWQINDLLTPFSAPFVFLLRILSDVVAVSSEAVHKTYFSPNFKTVRLYSAVDPRELNGGDRVKMRSEFGVASGTVLIGTIGNVNKFKGHMDFVRAAKLIKDKSSRPVRFVFVGLVVPTWEYYYKQLREVAREIGVDSDLIFTGGRSDVPDILAALDIYVHPSLSESFGLSVIEAMAAGKPVVATSVGGIPEIIPDGRYGLIVPPGNPSDLASAVLRYLADSGFANSISANGRARVENVFGIEQFVENHTKMYNMV